MYFRTRSSMACGTSLGSMRLLRVGSCAAFDCVFLLLIGSALASAQESVNPLGAGSSPKSVEIGIVILDVFSMDNVEQTTAVGFIVRARWHDESLAGV